MAKHGLHVEILAEWPTEAEALQHEKVLIDSFRYLKTGLVNLTDGGEGLSNPAPEVREAIRERTRKQWADDREKLIFAQTSPEAIAKRSASLKRAFARPGARERRSELLKAANRRPEIIAKRHAITSQPEYRQKMSEILRAVRAKPEVKAKHDAANAKKKAKTAARKANAPTQVKMTKREAGIVAGQRHKERAEARRALLPPAERSRLEKDAARQLEKKRRARAHQNTSSGVSDADGAGVSSGHRDSPSAGNNSPVTA